MMGASFAKVEGSFISEDLMRRIEMDAAQRIEAAAVDLHAAAQRTAPVRTGKYRDSLLVEDRSQGPVISYRVWSRVAYARFIRSAKIGTQRSTRGFRAVFTEDLGKPAREKQRVIVAEVAAYAAEVLGG